MKQHMMHSMLSECTNEVSIIALLYMHWNEESLRARNMNKLFAKFNFRMIHKTKKINEKLNLS